MAHRRDHTEGRELQRADVDAYDLGFTLARRPGGRRVTKFRREVQLNDQGQPTALIEESVVIEEHDY